MTLDLLNKADEPQVALDKLNAAIKAITGSGIQFTNWSMDGITLMNGVKWYDDTSKMNGYAYVDLGGGHKIVSLQFELKGFIGRGEVYVTIPKILVPKFKYTVDITSSGDSTATWDIQANGNISMHGKTGVSDDWDKTNAWYPIHVTYII